MADFAKENINRDDYQTLNDMYARQLEQKGWTKTWGENEEGEYGSGYVPPNAEDGDPVQNLYDAWTAATGTPTDLKLGIDKEPRSPGYRPPF
jgi:hypothetical protein